MKCRGLPPAGFFVRQGWLVQPPGNLRGVLNPASGSPAPPSAQQILGQPIVNIASAIPDAALGGLPTPCLYHDGRISHSGQGGCLVLDMASVTGRCSRCSQRDGHVKAWLQPSVMLLSSTPVAQRDQPGCTIAHCPKVCPYVVSSAFRWLLGELFVCSESFVCLQFALSRGMH